MTPHDAMIWLGKQRGYLSLEQLDNLLPDNEDNDVWDEVLTFLDANGIPLLDNNLLPTDSHHLLYNFGSEIVEGWKTYPIRLRGPEDSKCCLLPTLLVKSMKRGFVTANCSACGAPKSLAEYQFRGLFVWVSCPLCKKQMAPEMLRQVKGLTMYAGNYGYACHICRLYVLLADLLPIWKDIV